MKLSKSTTILANVVLILAIAILMKFLVAIPKNVEAAAPGAYAVVEMMPLAGVTPDVFEQKLDEMARQGWRLVTTCLLPHRGSAYLIYSR
ncbi:MAG: hypothetical protein KA243_01055 [Candidatus Aminicenantes bacterium]|nr:hypothetical protein [Candidatus Aminicenantes bacterium]